ncbi:MAG: hypothetical protein AB7D03_03815 [Thiomicrospira sp.]
MALTKDRNTAWMNADLVAVAVAAGAKIYAGALVVINASGYAEPGSTATGLTYFGRADEYIDNTDGSNGAQVVKVRRGVAFGWANDGSITQAHLGATCYIVDDETVAATDGTGTRSAAGKIVSIDSDGVWVE